MRVNLYPILITSLGLLAGVSFYQFYHLVAPQNTITKNTITREEPLDLQKLSPIKLPNTNITTLETQTEHIAIETPEQTQEIYVAITPDNYDEIMEQANEAFVTVETYAQEIEIALLEEEANRNE